MVRVSLNTVEKGDIFVQRTLEGDFLVQVVDLKSMGFVAPAGPVIIVDNASHIALRSMPGVRFAFGERLLTLSITAEPQLLASASLSPQGGSRTRGISTQNNSAFLNYALDYADAISASGGTINLTAETGIRYGDYLFTTNATSRAIDGSSRLTRLMSTVTRDDRDTLQRFVVGDFFTSAKGLGNTVNMGGLSISKLYGLDPYFIRNPLQNIRGLAATPSQLELYIDGQRIRSEQIQPGGFELRDVLAYGGASTAQVVLRDAFGRVQQFDYSFYFSDQPLARGLHDYSYSVGALREDFGLQSNRYGAVAFSAFHRYGLSDTITLGGFAEGKRGMLNGGPYATVVLGNAGVLNLTLASSRFQGQLGHATSAIYSFQSRRWSLGMELRRESGSYATLGNPVVISDRKYDASASAAYNVPGAGSVSVSYSASAGKGSPGAISLVGASPLSRSRVTALGYSTPLLSNRSSLTARISQVHQDQERRHELFVGLTYNFDNNYSVATNWRKDQTGSSEFIQLTKNQPVGEGLGFSVSGGHSNGSNSSSNAQSSIQYNAPAAIFRGNYSGTFNQGQSTHGIGLSLAGGIGYVDGQVGFGRPISDSFGIVKVNSLAGVDVTVNGQAMGKTDSRGTLFLPSLSAYYDSDISISPGSVPMEYSVPVVKIKLSPSLRSGSIINFEVARLQAFTGSIQIEEQGRRRPLEFIEATLAANGALVQLQSGRRGEFYLENLKPGTYKAALVFEGKRCLIDLTIPESVEAFVELGEVLCRPAP